jgi:hypothetical protein
LAAAAAGVVVSILAVAVGIRLGPLKVGPLGFQSNRNDLISRSLPWNKRFIDWQDNFPGTYDLAIAVDAADQDGNLSPERTEGARRLVDRLTTSLDPRHFRHVTRVVSKVTFSPRAIRLAPLPEFKDRTAQIEDARSLLESPTPAALLGRVIASLNEPSVREDESEAHAKLGDLISLIKSMGRTLADPQKHSFAPGMTDRAAYPDDTQRLGSEEYLTSTNGRLFFIRVTPRKDETALNALAAAVDSIRSVIAGVREEFPRFDVGLTGIEVIEADETKAATTDSMWTSTLAAVLITALLIAAFHSFRTPLLAMLSLLVGVAWSFGFATVVIGHLQVISIVFTVMLLGLGIDYGIYLAARYELTRHRYPDDLEGFTHALSDTLQTMGPGMFTGAITTSVAFAMTLLTDFKGVAEMGMIAGGGVLLCYAAIFSVFPALLRIFRSGHRHVKPMGRRFFHFYDERLSIPFSRHPKLTLGVCILLLSASLVAIGNMTFDYDLLKLQPEGIDSVTWARRIARDGGESLWTGVSIVTGATEEERLATAQQRKQAFVEQSGTIGTVRGIGFLFPEDEKEKVALLTKTRARLDSSLRHALDGTAAPAEASPDFVPALRGLRVVAAAALQREKENMPPAIREKMAELITAIDTVSSTAEGLPAGERTARLQELSRQYRKFRRWTARTIEVTLDPSPLTLKDLPPELMRPYIGTDEYGRPRYVLDVCPQLPDDPESPVDGPLHPRFLPHFIADMQAVDPYVTGVIVQIFNSGDLIKRS